MFRYSAELLVETIRSFIKDDGFHLSAAVAFYAVISVIPIIFLILFASGVVLGSSERVYMALVEFIKELHPYVEEKLLLEIKGLSDRAGYMGWFGSGFLLWISTMMVSSLEVAFSRIFRVTQKRSLFLSFIMAVAVIPLGLIVILFDVALSMTARFMESFGLDWFIIHGGMLSKGIPVVVLMLFFMMLYKVIPHRKIPFSKALLGGAICTAFLELAKYLFNIYLSFGGNPAGFVYGSLKALIYVVIWVFYLAVIILFTGEIVSVLVRRKEGL